MSHRRRAEYDYAYYEAREGSRFLRRALFLVVPTVIAFGGFSYACSWFGEAATVAREEFGPRGGLSKYEWFRDKHESITAVKAKVAHAAAEQKAFLESAGPRDKWTFEDKQEASRLSAVLNATKNILAEMVSEYNSNSKKFNHSAFRAADLPHTESEE